MIDSLKNFGKNIKNYIGYIATLGFKELGIHFVSLLFLIFIALLMYIPVGLVGDFAIVIINGIGNIPNIIYTVVDFVIELISLIATISVFIYVFNKRYTELYIKEINNSNNKVLSETNISNNVDRQNEELELDLPKKK